MPNGVEPKYDLPEHMPVHKDKHTVSLRCASECVFAICLSWRSLDRMWNTRMVFHLSLKIGGSEKFFKLKITDEITCMPSHVHNQISLTRVSFAANRTGTDGLSVMAPHVYR